jgi:hypothetical protein
MKPLEESIPMKISKVNATLPVAQVITITAPVYVQPCHEHTQGDGDDVHDTNIMESNNSGFGLDLESQIMISNRPNHEFTRAYYRRQLQQQQQPRICNNPMFMSYNYNGYVMSSEDLFCHRIKVLCVSCCIIICCLSVVGMVVNS